jgi:hypothetical protein
MAKVKTNYTAADIENIDSKTLAGMLNDLGKDIEQLEVVCNYRQQALDKANACLDAVSAVLKMR